MSMFTKEEAVCLLTDKMGVTNVEQRLETDRGSLLDDIIVAWHTKLIFHNLRLLSTPPCDRHRPTLEEIKEDVMSGVGGLCYNLNVAAFFLVQALGYRVSHASATCTSSVMFPGNHIITYVHDLYKPGDKHLMEVGFGFPTYRAISVDFEKESPIFVDSFIEYKYIKHDGKILRMHRKGDPIRASGKINPVTDFYIDQWRRFYMVDLEGTTNLECFNDVFETVWTDPTTSPFHTSLRVIGFPCRKAVMVVNEKIIKENDNGELKPKEIEGGDRGIIACLREIFPVFPEAMVKNAVANYKGNPHEPCNTCNPQ